MVSNSFLEHVVHWSLIDREPEVWTALPWLFTGSYPLLLALGLLSSADTETCDKDKIPEKLLLDQLKDRFEPPLGLPPSWLQCILFMTAHASRDTNLCLEKSKYMPLVRYHPPATWPSLLLFRANFLERVDSAPCLCILPPTHVPSPSQKS